MFSNALALHSLLRWIVLLSLIVSIYFAYVGWFRNRPYTKFDNYLRIFTVSAFHIQLMVGLYLYFTSPLVKYFLGNFKESIHKTQLRFFGMEHISMMVPAVTFVSIGSLLACREKIEKEKFKKTAIRFSVAFLFIFTSIPWEFSPFTARPYFRLFN